MRRLLPLIAPGILLAACAGPSYGPGRGGGYAEHRPTQPIYKIGAPYQINGIWYYPRVDYSYDQTGVASWYGEQFEGRRTANGEIFNLNDLSAAHRTLPMPSIVEVTNLQNGRSLRLRVNDRGPFADGRIIDVSRRAAQLLGFEVSGTASVRVQILPRETIMADAAVIRSAGQNPKILAANAPPGLLPVIQEAEAQAPAITPTAAPAPMVQQAAAPAPVIRQAPASAPVVQEAVVQQPAPIRPAPVRTPVPPAPVYEAMAQPPAREPAPRQPSVWDALPRTAPVSEPAMPQPVAREAPPPTREAEFREAVARERPAPMPVADHPFFHTLQISARPRRIFVQAGSFSEMGSAITLSSKIAPLGSVAIVTTSERGYPVYRVRLGPVANGREAVDLLSRLVGSGYAGARIVEN